ncbi:hypothetical protein QYE76_024509 [Lolium multiflorum]|uniref:Uncharacterized protein n=1 Tax=Lolium multiflorum TaxID=4521 RepID=A0AAD8VTC7_LOLMU|nr:hypothetical protein QYE76_024509 [Lolium multiflorum]
MATANQGESDRPPPPLGLRGLSRVSFQPRSPPPGSVPPPRRLGLTGRASMQFFSIGAAGSEPHPPPPILPRRRVGLARPSRPPAPNEAGSSNWSASVGGAGAASAGIGSSAFVGFSLVNGGGGISFGSGGGISFESGGSESMGFTFGSGAGGIRITDGFSSAATTEGTEFGLGGHNGQDMSNGESSTIGYRGVGYNPNFSHADEFPPTQVAGHLNLSTTTVWLR